MADANAGAGRLLQSARIRLPGAAQRIVPGAALSLTVAMAAMFVGQQYGGPVMLYALLLGMPFHFLAGDERCAAGIAFSARTLLRLGVALLGVQVSFGEILSLGMPTAALAVAGVALTIALGSLIGRALGMTADHAVLSAGAVAICGASAALAISAILPQHRNSERNVILTVVGVTTLSTVAMVLYPLIAQALDMTGREAGIFIGATIHDVAQVMGAGYMISDEAGETAAIVKLMRVACLVPAVMILGRMFRGAAPRATGRPRPPLLPAFLVGFVVLVVLNSVHVIPAPIADLMGETSRLCLIIAVAALGVKTSLRNMSAAGFGPVATLVSQTLLLALFALGVMAGLPGLFA